MPDDVALTQGCCIFTDGSKTENNVGASWVAYMNGREITNNSYTLPTHTTVYEAEATALVKAMEYVTNTRGDMPHEISFFTDNQAILHTLSRTKITTYISCRLVRAAREVSEAMNGKISFIWFKGHSGITGNERADYLARNSDMSNFIHTPISMAVIKKRLIHITNQTWDSRWANMKKCRQSRQMITFKPSKDNSKLLLGRGRIFCRTAVALLTGHNNLKYHQFLRHDTDDNYSPICRFCSEELETSHHLMTECKNLARRRKELESPDNPKKGPDTEIYRLGIWKLIIGENNEIGEESIDSE